MNMQDIQPFLSAWILMFLSSCRKISVIIRAIRGFVIVKNGASAHTLILQNEPKSQTMRNPVTSFPLWTKDYRLRTGEAEKRTQNEPKRRQFEQKPKRKRWDASPSSSLTHPVPHRVTAVPRFCLTNNMNLRKSVKSVVAKKRNKANLQARKNTISYFIKKTSAPSMWPADLKTNPIKANYALVSP